MIRALLEFPLHTPADIQMAVLALYRGNVHYLRTNPGRWTDLYESGIRYQQEPLNSPERWLSIPRLYQRMRGDCEDIAAARAAQLTVHDGIPAVPIVRRAGPGLWHILVQWEGGTVEDPSEVLGMPPNPYPFTEPLSYDVQLGGHDSVIGGSVSGKARRRLAAVIKPIGKLGIAVADRIPVASAALDAGRGVRDAVRMGRPVAPPALPAGGGSTDEIQRLVAPIWSAQ